MTKFDTAEDWIFGSFCSLEFEYTDRRVHPRTLLIDGKETSAEGHIRELDHLIERAYEMMEGEPDPTAELRYADDRERARDIRLAQRDRF